MKKKKRYYKPEVKVVELSFNAAQLGACHTPTVTFPQIGPVPCTVEPCLTP